MVSASHFLVTNPTANTPPPTIQANRQSELCQPLFSPRSCEQQWFRVWMFVCLAIVTLPFDVTLRAYWVMSLVTPLCPNNKNMKTSAYNKSAGNNDHFRKLFLLFCVYRIPYRQQMSRHIHAPLGMIWVGRRWSCKAEGRNRLQFALMIMPNK